MKIKLLIAFLVDVWCLFASTAYSQDSTHATDSSAQQNILGMPSEALVAGVVTVLVAVFVYVLVQRRQLKQKDEEIAQRDTELSLKAHELEMKANESEQDRIEKREAELKAEREKKKHFETFEERYLDYQWISRKSMCRSERMYRATS